jgi:hypothetical protein
MGIFQADMRKSDFVRPAAAAIVKGECEMVEDVLTFAENDAAITIDVTRVFKCVQCRADKKVGTAEDILQGQRLFVDLTDDHVSATKGVGYLFCGWAKEDADGSDETVWMEFDGTFTTLY